ncbi:MAG TPA: polysaccharide lyase [Candidatus Aquilonibacter sp.]|nr:polysaccharide lyase [Candidatus Aquilonibacter sp.]
MTPRLATRIFGLCALLTPATRAFPQAPASEPINVYDGFETSTLSNLWSTERLEPNSFRMESQIVRAGHQAIAITVRPHDKFEAGRNGNSDSERDELLEARPLTARQGVSYEYSFSMLFPASFPIVPTRLVIAQWKDYCGGENKPCDDDSPVLALRYISGELLLTQDLDHHHVILWRQRGEFRNRWLDFRIRARFQPDDQGRVQFWFNNQPILDHTGLTLNHPGPASGYYDRGYIYFKMGLYRDVMQQPMTVYIDEYRKRDLRPGEF